MKEKSVIVLLDQQKAKNEKAYRTLFGKLNTSGMPNFRDLPEIGLVERQLLTNAGFASRSLLDKLSEESPHLISHLAKQDINRFYLEEDIKQVAIRYGLKRMSTRYYQGITAAFFPKT